MCHRQEPVGYSPIGGESKEQAKSIMRVCLAVLLSDRVSLNPVRGG